MIFETSIAKGYYSIHITISICPETLANPNFTHFMGINTTVVYSEVVLQRCVPVPEAPLAVDVLSSMYASLNSPAALEQLLSGLYSTWTHILLLTLLAFGKCSLWM
jgi:hypothetical protein